MELSSNSFDFFKLLSSNQISFQDHLYISPINLISISITLYRNGITKAQRLSTKSISKRLLTLSKQSLKK